MFTFLLKIHVHPLIQDIFITVLEPIPADIWREAGYSQGATTGVEK